MFFLLLLNSFICGYLAFKVFMFFISTYIKQGIGVYTGWPYDVFTVQIRTLLGMNGVLLTIISDNRHKLGQSNTDWDGCLPRLHPSVILRVSTRLHCTNRNFSFDWLAMPQAEKIPVFLALVLVYNTLMLHLTVSLDFSNHIATSGWFLLK